MLELIDLHRRYGHVVALEGLSFSMDAGEMLGFVGPNGAGKTTAMRIVLGVLAPDSGEVRWQGRAMDLAVRRRFGYMPEERGLYPKRHSTPAPLRLERWTPRIRPRRSAAGSHSSA
jgi:ABC-2 type transport system ATP-binding protein